MLRELNLGHTHVGGPIPHEWGSLFYLRDLVLAGTRVSGTLPDALHALDELETIDLSDTDVTNVGAELRAAWCASPPEACSLMDPLELRRYDCADVCESGEGPCDLTLDTCAHVVPQGGGDLTDDDWISEKNAEIDPHLFDEPAAMSSPSSSPSARLRAWLLGAGLALLVVAFLATCALAR